MGSSKMNTITDPLASQKTTAANLGLQNYQQASQNIPQLQNVASGLGQTQMQTLGNQSPLFQSLYNSANQDVSGTGGPFSALTQNLLGSFDTQQNNTQQQLQQQLQAQGLGGSGAGMAVLGGQGVNAAQARAGILDQNQINMMNFADQIAQQLGAANQQQGYINPMAAISQMQTLGTPPNFQNVDNSYYTPAPKDSGFQQGFSDTLAAANTVANLMSGMQGGSPSGGSTASTLGATGVPSTNQWASFYGAPGSTPFRG